MSDYGSRPTITQHVYDTPPSDAGGLNIASNGKASMDIGSTSSLEKPFKNTGF